MSQSAEWPEIGRRVREARLAADLSQDQLAARIGLERSMLAKIESGDRRIDAIELTRLGAALRLPLDHFLHVAPAVVSHRAELLDEEATEAGGEAYRIEAELLKWLRDIRQLIDLGVLTPNRLLAYTPPVTSDEDARHAARWLRDELGLGNEPIPSMLAVGEAVGLYAVVADLPGDGASLIDGDVAAAVISQVGEPGRRRTTAAHELGHVILGDEYTTDLAVNASRRDREALINAFAAEFLLPASVVAAHGTEYIRPALIGLAARYRTSWSLAVRQAGRAGVLDSRAAQRMLPQAPTRAEILESVGWLPQPDLDAVRVPPAFAQAVLDARRQNLITLIRAVELLRGQISEEDFPAQADDEVAP